MDFEKWKKTQKKLVVDASVSPEWYCHGCDQNYTEDAYSCYAESCSREITDDDVVICNGKQEHYCSESCLNDHFDDDVLPEIEREEAEK